MGGSHFSPIQFFRAKPPVRADHAPEIVLVAPAVPADRTDPGGLRLREPTLQAAGHVLEYAGPSAIAARHSAAMA